MNVSNDVFVAAVEALDQPELVERLVEGIILVEVENTGSLSEVSPTEIEDFVGPLKVTNPVDAFFDRHDTLWQYLIKTRSKMSTDDALLREAPWIKRVD